MRNDTSSRPNLPDGRLRAAGSEREIRGRHFTLVTRESQFSDMLRMSEANRLKDLHFMSKKPLPGRGQSIAGEFGSEGSEGQTFVLRRALQRLSASLPLGTVKVAKSNVGGREGAPEFKRLLSQDNVRLTLRRHLRFFGKALIERAKIDHNSLVAPAADLVYAITCGHFKVDPFPLDPDYLGGRADFAAYWRGGQVFYIHCSADRAFTRVQERSDGIERSVFHDQNHYGRRKHLRQHGVLELVGEMFGLHPQRRRSSGSYWNFAHLLTLLISDRNIDRFTPNRSTKVDVWLDQR